jgi:hypothetical protein
MIKVNTRAKRIELFDNRFYTADSETYYPSVTTVLHEWSPEPFLIEWWKNNGRNSDILLREAAERGTLVHESIEKLLQGLEIKYEDINNFECWKMILKFKQWFIKYDVEPLHIEMKMVSKKYGVGGTADLFCYINKELWYIDHKTSNSIQHTHHIQSAVYREMFEDLTGERIVRTGILWLNAKTKGEDKTGKKMQGRGWQVIESKDSHIDLMKDWFNLKAIYDRRHPVAKPHNAEYPLTIKL